MLLSKKVYSQILLDAATQAYILDSMLRSTALCDLKTVASNLWQVR